MLSARETVRKHYFNEPMSERELRFANILYRNISFCPIKFPGTPDVPCCMCLDPKNVKYKDDDWCWDCLQKDIMTFSPEWMH